MIADTETLFARRAYEFAADELRLSALATLHVVQQVQSAFALQGVQVGTPPATFGPVAETIPPGVVFQNGMASLGGTIIPIRSIHFEPTRIVIEVVAPSARIDDIFDMLRAIVDANSFAFEGSAIGEPIRRRDYSALTAKLSVSPDRLLAPELRSLLPDTLGREQAANPVLVPLVIAQLLTEDQVYTGLSVPNFELTLRQNTTPSDRTYLSATFLDSEQHRKFISQLESALTNP